MDSFNRKSAVELMLRHGAIYAACVVATLWAAFAVDYHFDLPDPALHLLGRVLTIALPLKLAVFYLLRLHRISWRTPSVTEAVQITFSCATASIAFASAAVLIWRSAIPYSVYLMDFVFCILGLAGVCFFARFRHELYVSPSSRQPEKHVLIYGAGSAGLALLREIRSNASLRYTVAGLLDDDPDKRGAVFMGAPVLGRGRAAALQVQRLRSRGVMIEEIIVALPSATGAQMQEALANCRAAGVACKTIPSFGELLTGKVLSAQVRNVRITDLLGRKPVVLETMRIRSFLANSTVLVTGGAGSIGSELCRQIAGFGASKIVVFDQAESDLFRIDMELRDTFSLVEIVPEIGNLCDAERLEQVLLKHRITHIFHAAAYKHVPMMEMHPQVAVYNNVIGTWNLAHAAARHGVPSFLMISSDKAVNPTNVMGATKRAAELIISSMPRSNTNFVSVRFGNVLASNGSVVPIFQSQIARGGPVTVTHPEIRRYFMTIPEAVQLVLQASTLGSGSEIFVLDMGEPIKIMHLAENLIRLSRLTPYKDIEIRITGLRPGEKLFEEIRTKGENILPTCHDKIKIFAGPVPDRREIEEWLEKTRSILRTCDAIEAVKCLKELIPEYEPSAVFKNVAEYVPIAPAGALAATSVQ